MARQTLIGESFIPVVSQVAGRICGVSSDALRGIGKAELVDEGMVNDVGVRWLGWVHNMSEGDQLCGPPIHKDWCLLKSGIDWPRMLTYIRNFLSPFWPTLHMDIISSSDFQLFSLSLPKKHYFLNCYFDSSDDSSITYLESCIHHFPQLVGELPWHK